MLCFLNQYQREPSAPRRDIAPPPMTADQFVQTLLQEGFEPAIPVTREPGGMLGEHTRSFEAKALILAGEIGITVAGFEQVYRVGDMFHLPAGTPHTEWYGPTGVRYLVGRKTAN